MTTASALAVHGLSVGYGRLPVLRDVTFELPVGRVLGVVGANGAGKSTMLKAISGLIRPWSGEIQLGARRIDHVRAEAIVGMGVAHVPQGRHIFIDMTVRENLIMGATPRHRRGDPPADIEATIEEWIDRFPILRTRADQPAGVLSGGEQQLLAIGRALVGDPAIVLMDEPTLGLSPSARDVCFALIEEIRSMGRSIVLVEQDRARVEQLADALLTLEFGKVRGTINTGKDTSPGLLPPEDPQAHARSSGLP